MITGGLDPRQVELWQQLQRLTREMREAQIAYFKHRTQQALKDSKRLERQVDDLLIRLSYLAPEPPAADAGAIQLGFGEPAP